MAKSKIYSISSKKIIKAVLVFIALLIAATLAVAIDYIKQNLPEASIDEIIFYLSNGTTTTTEMASFTDAAIERIPLIGLLMIIFSLPILIDQLLSRSLLFKIQFNWFGKLKKYSLKLKGMNSTIFLGCSLLLVVMFTATLFQQLQVFDYFRLAASSSQIYEEKYVDPRNVKLQFPQKKRNLIYIYMESMENTLLSNGKKGGQMDQSIMPELEKIATQNLNFSNLPQGIGGSIPLMGAHFTVGGMTAQSSGIPLITPFLASGNDMEYVNKFLPGAYSLGQILEKEGYNQSFAMGSVAEFGGRKQLLSQHGNYKILDYNYAKENNIIDKDYHVFWGMEDRITFKMAKDEVLRLSKMDAPFNFQVLTVDTHMPHGYLDDYCKNRKHLLTYDNAYSCSSEQVGDFVNWILAQDFAKDTTIILTGDHLGMLTQYYTQKVHDDKYQRTIYNAFINSAIKPVKSQNRQFTSLDMYPTTLAAMGVKIQGDKLGFGVNLFSDKKTLLEEVGNVELMNDEFRKRSNYYLTKIYR